MARLFVLFLLLLAAPLAHAGDEDERATKKPVEAATPIDTAIPKDVEAPAPTVGETIEPAPDFEEQKPETTSPAPRKNGKALNLDENVDYSRLLDTVEPYDPPQGVLAPALGFRGYRPNLVAAGGGDRLPGFGALVEYSWNRIGIGACASYRSTKGEDATVKGYGIAGLYGLYRWLPFDMSPYFLMGLEAGSLTDEPVGGMLGLGVETKIYSGWTLLFGWTYHSVVHRGFLGGAFGWSF